MAVFVIPIYVLAASILTLTATADDVTLVRGVEIKFQPFYPSNRDFTCLDGTKTIPFSSVNDDYCDCSDGTDEPGTAACPEGRYYCYNVGHKARYLQSSRVNDGICDCCDGSDEYDSSVACFNECEKHGIAEAALKKEEMAESLEGARIRNDYIQLGKEKQTEKTARIETINSLLEQRRNELEEARAIKEAAEKPETEAKDKHQKVWDAAQAGKREEEDKVERNEAFDALDTDKDGWLTIQELLSNHHLDSDQSENDAKDVLSGESMVDREGMVNVWKSIKPKYLKDGRPDPSTFDESNIDEKPIPPPSTVDDKDAKKGESRKSEPTKSSDILEKLNDLTPDKDVENVEKEMNKIYEDNEEEEEKEEEHYKSAESYAPDDKDDDDDDDDGDDGREDGQDDHDDHDSKSKEETLPEYDEPTKEFIRVADDARGSFDGAEKSVKDLETEKKDLEEYLQMDFGTNQEFSQLKGECFEYTDREYVYKLCPFDRVTQRNKDGGGSETELGSKMHWSGMERNRFNVMKYDGGQTCWNGPARSTVVRLHCGKDNVVTSVSEPSRCEYEMHFKTPALCEPDAAHDEL